MEFRAVLHCISLIYLRQTSIQSVFQNFPNAKISAAMTIPGWVNASPQLTPDLPELRLCHISREVSWKSRVALGYVSGFQQLKRSVEEKHNLCVVL
ncbi:hypothetical protein SDC9_61392 [bioreactor metagenome]|uniref:Uncharacterized protein n=1 Tax=bioreactor metagenome TaxID=1076179 RepID=A0A644XGJ1_9ZZZZ